MILVAPSAIEVKDTGLGGRAEVEGSQGTVVTVVSVLEAGMSEVGALSEVEDGGSFGEDDDTVPSPIRSEESPPIT